MVSGAKLMEAILKGRGLEMTTDPGLADAVIINTCSVRKTAENRIWGRLGFYNAEKRRHPLTLIVTGCMAERMKEKMLFTVCPARVFRFPLLVDLLFLGLVFPVGVFRSCALRLESRFGVSSTTGKQ